MFNLDFSFINCILPFFLFFLYCIFTYSNFLAFISNDIIIIDASCKIYISYIVCLFLLYCIFTYKLFGSHKNVKIYIFQIDV